MIYLCTGCSQFFNWLPHHVTLKMVCNHWMAKHKQCVQAIQDCMRKMKAEYHNVIGLIHRKYAEFDVNKPHPLIKINVHPPSPVRMLQSFKPLNRNEKFVNCIWYYHFNINNILTWYQPQHSIFNAITIKALKCKTFGKLHKILLLWEQWM